MERKWQSYSEWSKEVYNDGTPWKKAEPLQKELYKNNELVLESFEESLGTKLAEKTIKKHSRAVESLLTYLTEVRTTPVRAISDGELDDYLGYRLERVAGGRTQAKSHIGSIKKFYAFLHAEGEIMKQQLKQAEEDFKINRQMIDEGF